MRLPMVAIAASLAAGLTNAAPMGFKSSFMAMVDVGPNWKEGWVNYALTSQDAIGAGGVSMRSDDGTKSRRLIEANYTRLLERWNQPDAQANLWFFAGLGGIRGNDFDGSRIAIAPGLQIDYETTRIYLSATARLYRAEQINPDFASARGGFSFYEIDYDEIQPWLIVEARRMRGLSDKTEITPMVRLIHNRYFVEFGVNNSRQGRANFMYIF